MLPGSAPLGATSTEAIERTTSSDPTAEQMPPDNGDLHAGAARDTGARAASHPAAAFTAQLAKHPVEAMETSRMPSPDLAEASTHAFRPDASIENGNFRASDSMTSGSSSIPAAMGDAGATRINASAAPDQTVARVQRVAAHPAIAQIAIVVTKAAQEGVDRITIKLQPPELGRIDVRLDVGVDGRIQAVFAAERSATVDILQRDVRELERALQNAGLSTDPGSLSFGLKQQSGHGMARFGAPLIANEIASSDLESIAVARTAAAARAAVDGRLDIHV